MKTDTTVIIQQVKTTKGSNHVYLVSLNFSTESPVFSYSTNVPIMYKTSRLHV